MKCYPPSKTEVNVVKALYASGLQPIHQYPISGTYFTADIYFPQQKLIVEVDGHPSHFTKAGRKKRKVRDKMLKERGYKVLHLNPASLKKGLLFCVNRVMKDLK